MVKNEQNMIQTLTKVTQVGDMHVWTKETAHTSLSRVGRMTMKLGHEGGIIKTKP